MHQLMDWIYISCSTPYVLPNKIHPTMHHKSVKKEDYPYWTVYPAENWHAEAPENSLKQISQGYKAD